MLYTLSSVLIRMKNTGLSQEDFQFAIILLSCRYNLIGVLSCAPVYAHSTSSVFSFSAKALQTLFMLKISACVMSNYWQPYSAVCFSLLFFAPISQTGTWGILGFSVMFIGPY